MADNNSVLMLEDSGFVEADVVTASPRMDEECSCGCSCTGTQVYSAEWQADRVDVYAAMRPMI